MTQLAFAPIVGKALCHHMIPPFQADVRVLAMLSRMNLTLSALVASNGLNLGTRSRAANADVNLDGQTLYILTSHHDVMREGVKRHSFSKPKSKQGVRFIPGSISPVQVQQPSCDPWQQGGWAVSGCSVTDPRPADLAATCEPRRDERVSRFPTRVPSAGSTARRDLDCQALPLAGLADSSLRRYRTAQRALAIASLATARATTVGK
jgi:hypothetical protein